MKIFRTLTGIYQNIDCICTYMLVHFALSAATYDSSNLALLQDQFGFAIST